MVDGWKLERLLGQGGNGEVWVAQREGREAALKLLKRDYVIAGGKRFTRFRDEARMQSQLASRISGVLPLLDSSVPNDPAPDAPVWLATPVAVPLENELQGGSLQEVIEAVAGVAETLAALHAEGISHRDIKPSNLYSYAGRAVVGDLGLVDFPDKDSLTETGERLGPRNFLAPEMVDEAKQADGTQADVYCLAKTLWVLVTGQRVPPPGELRVENEQLSISGYRNVPRVRQLDLLIERATRHDPDRRPTMAEFATELRARLSPRQVGPVPELADVIARVRSQSEPAVREHQERSRQSREAEVLYDRLNTLMEPIAAALAETGLSPGKTEQVTSIDSILGRHRVLDGSRTFWSKGIVARACKPTTQLIVLSPEASLALDSLNLVCAVGLEVRVDGSACLCGGYVIESCYGLRRVGGSEKVAALGSATLDNAVVELFDQLTSLLPEALGRFAQWLETGQPFAPGS
jgi:serine/threonine protein kinase